MREITVSELKIIAGGNGTVVVAGAMGAVAGVAAYAGSSSIIQSGSWQGAANAAAVGAISGALAAPAGIGAAVAGGIGAIEAAFPAGMVGGMIENSLNNPKGLNYCGGGY